MIFMGFFDSDERMIENAKETQQGMKNKIKNAKPEELKDIYNDSVAMENVYRSYLSDMNPGSDYYNVVKGIYQSQQSITEQVKNKVERDDCD